MKDGMRKVMAALLVGLCVSGCGKQEPESAMVTETVKPSMEALSDVEEEEMKMIMNVNGRDFVATLEENSAVDALVEMMEEGPVTISLHDYAGF